MITYKKMLIFVTLVAALGLAFWQYQSPHVYAHSQPKNGMCQTVSAPEVDASPPDMIDGAKYPELISDEIAYRLFFVTVAAPEGATKEQKARQRAYLRSAGLKEEEIQSAFGVLATFKSQYDELVGRYNDSVQSANETDGEPDLETFLTQQDKLVVSTKWALEAAISPQSVSQFEAHLQHEKRNMKIAKEAR